jgi:3-(3-hydroxy-phenyl)propionate hydroxylase
LLDSYGEERKAHVTELTTRIKGIGQLVGERDMQKARARDAQLLAACGGVVKSVPRQDVQPALQGGLLSRSPHAARGTLFPQPWVVHGAGRQRLDDVVGCGWRLVLSPQAAAWPIAVPPWMARVAVGGPQAGALQECDGVLAAWWARMGAQAAIVRPDHYVYAAVADAPALAQTLADLASRLSSHP